jgi:hypothetical protein
VKEIKQVVLDEQDIRAAIGDYVVKNGYNPANIEIKSDNLFISAIKVKAVVTLGMDKEKFKRYVDISRGE